MHIALRAVLRALAVVAGAAAMSLAAADLELFRLQHVQSDDRDRAERVASDGEVIGS